MAQSHDDRDFTPIPEAFLDRIRDLQERGGNRITAGAPGEQVLGEWQHGDVLVRKLPDDPLALRISIGQATGIGEGAYLVFRGGRAECIHLLERALAALKA